MIFRSSAAHGLCTHAPHVARACEGDSQTAFAYLPPPAPVFVGLTVLVIDKTRVALGVAQQRGHQRVPISRRGRQVIWHLPVEKRARAHNIARHAFPGDSSITVLLEQHRTSAEAAKHRISHTNEAASASRRPVTFVGAPHLEACKVGRRCHEVVEGELLPSIANASGDLVWPDNNAFTAARGRSVTITNHQPQCRSAPTQQLARLCSRSVNRMNAHSPASSHTRTTVP